MPRAEVGSTKHIANQMKAKGLQRLRWYCQACERQMRDENGYKCHVASESHVRNMQILGENPRRAISEYSNQFQRDFIQLLRTGHGEKKVNVNHFYQEYISNKQHIHMNATRWQSLTEFAKHLGREGICRVEEDEKNSERGGASALMISWIDNSPEALRRQEALKKKDRQDKGDEEREKRMIAEQIRRAKRDGMPGMEDEDEQDDASSAEGIKRIDGEKIRLNFGAKKADEPENLPSPPLTEGSTSPGKDTNMAGTEKAADVSQSLPLEPGKTPAATTSKPTLKPISFSSAASKPKNVFAAASKKNALGGSKKSVSAGQQKPISEAERIMKEELERKRRREENISTSKKQRIT